MGRREVEWKGRGGGKRAMKFEGKERAGERDGNQKREKISNNF